MQTLTRVFVCMCVCFFISWSPLDAQGPSSFNIYFNVTITVTRVAERIATRPWLAKMAVIMIAQFEAKCDGFLSLFCRPVWMG